MLRKLSMVVFPRYTFKLFSQLLVTEQLIKIYLVVSLCLFVQLLICNNTVTLNEVL
jgi:hypothetical protein